MKKRKLLVPLTLVFASLCQGAFAQAPAETYKTKCAMCHGAAGAADTPAGKAMAVPSLHSAALVSASDSDLELAITKGKGKMPAYGTQFNKAQIDGLVSYVRTLQKSGK